MLRMLRNGKGFTLVEIAIVMVIIGIILGAVLKGQDLINNAKAKRLLNDTQGLMALSYTFYDRYGRFPGDCTNAGYITSAVVLTYTPASFTTTPAPAFCYMPGGTPGPSNASSQWNELLQAQLASGAPRDLGKNLYSGARYFAGGPAIGGVNYNIILNRGVPCYAGKAMDMAIDGTMDAGLGAIREVSGGAIRTTTNAWTTCTTEQTLVDVAYFFDRRPN